MSYELVANLASTTMNNGGTLSSGATSVTVTSAAAFSASGNFRILIESELIQVTAVSSNTFTLVRGVDGTTAASHADGNSVIEVVTALGLPQLIADRNLRGTFSAMPSAGVAGRIYRCTDVPFMYYDDGTNWNKYFGTYNLAQVPTTGWTGDAMTNFTFTTNNDMLNFIQPTGTGVFGAEYQTAPATPWSVRTAILDNPCPQSECQSIVGFRSATGQYVAWSMHNDSGIMNMAIGEWNTTTSFNSTVYGPIGFYTFGGLWFFKFQDDGTNLNFYNSQDGINFTLLYSQTRTHFLTGGPTGAALGWYNGNNAQGSVSFIDWTVGT